MGWTSLLSKSSTIIKYFFCQHANGQYASHEYLGLVYQNIQPLSHTSQTEPSHTYDTVTSLYQQLYLNIQSLLKTIFLNILVPEPGNITKKYSNLGILKLFWQQCPKSL